MIELRQSTASQEIPLGYFVDSTDGNTEETGLTIANTDIKIWKTGATTLANKNSGGATHISNGLYYCVLDATDTDTIGPLVVFVHVSGALAVRVECVVLDEAVYDVRFGTTAPATATNITALGNNTITAAAIADGAIDRAAFAADTGLQTARSNTAQTGNASSITLDASASATNNFYRGMAVYITGGTGVGQVRVITAYTGSSKQATVDRNWATNPDNTSTFAILPVDWPALNTTLQVTANVSQAVIRSGTAQSGSTSNTIKLDTGASATNNIYNGDLVTITGGTGLGQSRTIISYVGSTKVATVDKNWTTTPDNTSTFNILASTTPSTFSDQGVAQAGTTSTITLAATASATNSVYVGSIITILSGTDAGDTSEITAYNGTSKVATVSPNFAVAPDSTSGYAVIPVQAASGSTPSTDPLANAVPGAYASGTAGYVLGTNLDATVSSRSSLNAAAVNAEVVDALATDTYAEPAQGTPAATTSLAAKLNYLYKSWRNKKTQTSTQWSLLNDDASTVDHKATVADDGTTASKGEIATGP